MQVENQGWNAGQKAGLISSYTQVRKYSPLRVLNLSLYPELDMHLNLHFNLNLRPCFNQKVTTSPAYCGRAIA